MIPYSVWASMQVQSVQVSVWFCTRSSSSCSGSCWLIVVRDLTASLISEVCSDVELKPRLQPLSGEQFLHASANRDAEARLDIKARGFWGGAFECAFFDVRVFKARGWCQTL